MKEMNTTGDIFYPGNLVTNLEEAVVEVTGLHSNKSLFEGKFIKEGKSIERILGINTLLIKHYYKQYKSPEMELKTTTERVLEAASKCPTAKETLKTLFPDVFEEQDKKEKEEYEKSYWSNIETKFAEFLSGLTSVKPLSSHEYRFLSDRLHRSSNISSLIIDLLKNHKKAELLDYSKLRTINSFTINTNTHTPIFIDNGASGDSNLFNKVFILNSEYNWEIIKGGSYLNRDILVPTVK